MPDHVKRRPIVLFPGGRGPSRTEVTEHRGECRAFVRGPAAAAKRAFDLVFRTRFRVRMSYRLVKHVRRYRLNQKGGRYDAKRIIIILSCP